MFNKKNRRTCLYWAGTFLLPVASSLSHVHFVRSRFSHSSRKRTFMRISHTLMYCHLHRLLRWELLFHVCWNCYFIRFYFVRRNSWPLGLMVVIICDSVFTDLMKDIILSQYGEKERWLWIVGWFLCNLNLFTLSISTHH